jgi:uncharacterized membrane protein YidH (DUF202 family)
MGETNIQVELAIQRTALALERTQLAWVRTNFAILSAGLALDKGIQALNEADLLVGTDWLAGGHVVGVLLAGVATGTLAWATQQYTAQLKSVGGRSTIVVLLNPALMLSVLVVVLGVIVTGGLLLWR